MGNGVFEDGVMVGYGIFKLVRLMFFCVWNWMMCIILFLLVFVVSLFFVFVVMVLNEYGIEGMGVVLICVDEGCVMISVDG